MTDADQVCRLITTILIVRLCTGESMSGDAYAMAYPELSGLKGMKKKIKNINMVKNKKNKKTKGLRK